MSTVVQSILAGLGGMFGWGLYDFFGGLFSKKIGNFKTFFWSQLAGLVFASLLALVFGASLNVPTSTAILIPVAAILYTVAYLLFFKGFELGNVSVISATMNLWAVFTMLFAFIFLGQRLSTLQFVGVLMILVGVALVSLKWEDIKGKNIELLSGVKETFLAAVLFGIFWIFSEVISEKNRVGINNFIGESWGCCFYAGVLFDREASAWDRPNHPGYKAADLLCRCFRSGGSGMCQLGINGRRCDPGHSHLLGAIHRDNSHGSHLFEGKNQPAARLWDDHRRCRHRFDGILITLPLATSTRNFWKGTE